MTIVIVRVHLARFPRAVGMLTSGSLTERTTVYGGRSTGTHVFELAGR